MNRKKRRLRGQHSIQHAPGHNCAGSDRHRNTSDELALNASFRSKGKIQQPVKQYGLHFNLCTAYPTTGVPANALSIEVTSVMHRVAMSTVTRSSYKGCSITTRCIELEPQADSNARSFGASFFVLPALDVDPWQEFATLTFDTPEEAMVAALVAARESIDHAESGP